MYSILACPRKEEFQLTSIKILLYYNNKKMKIKIFNKDAIE